VPLQALLYDPANYDASKKYPMIVYTYELLTQGYHNYIAPRETDYYNATVFTQNGRVPRHAQQAVRDDRRRVGNHGHDQLRGPTPLERRQR
jgi:hypothetical protein